MKYVTTADRFCLVPDLNVLVVLWYWSGCIIDFVRSMLVLVRSLAICVVTINEMCVVWKFPEQGSVARLE